MTTGSPVRSKPDGSYQGGLCWTVEDQKELPGTRNRFVPMSRKPSLFLEWRPQSESGRGLSREPGRTARFRGASVLTRFRGQGGENRAAPTGRPATRPTRHTRQPARGRTGKGNAAGDGSPQGTVSGGGGGAQCNTPPEQGWGRVHRELNRRPGATGRAEPGGRQGRTRLQGPLVCVLKAAFSSHVSLETFPRVRSFIPMRCHSFQTAENI